MTLVASYADIEIYHDTRADEYYVYASDRLVRVCPSIGMAREVAAGC